MEKGRSSGTCGQKSNRSSALKNSIRAKAFRKSDCWKAMVLLPAFSLSASIWPKNSVNASSSKSMMNAEAIINGRCSQLLLC